MTGRYQPERAGGPLGYLHSAFPTGDGSADFDADADPRPDRIGEYRLLRKIGAGGSGEIWLAFQQALERTVAVKLLHRQGQANQQERARFLEEARLAARLQHPNIVTVLDYGDHQGRLYYVMEHVDGATVAVVIEALARLVHEADASRLLRLPVEIRIRLGIDAACAKRLEALVSGTEGTERSRRDGPDEIVTTLGLPSDLSETDDIRTAVQRSATHFLVEATTEVARAIEYAHGTGAVHGDIKPSNLILDRNGRIRVLDFGLAKFKGDPDDKRHPLEGTPQYMSPEQVAGASAAFSPLIDVYALGAHLYETLTLRPMYARGPTIEVLQRIVTEAPPLPRALNPRIHRGLEAIVLKSTARVPRNRYPSMAALADDLDRFLHHQPVSALGHRWLSTEVRDELRGHRGLQIAGVGFAILLVIAGFHGFSWARATLKERSTRQAAIADAKDALNAAEANWQGFEARITSSSGTHPLQFDPWAAVLADHAHEARRCMAEALRSHAFGDRGEIDALERRTWRLDVLRAGLLGRGMEFESALDDGLLRGWDDSDIVPELADLGCLAGLEIKLATAAPAVATISWIDPVGKKTHPTPVVSGELPLKAPRLLAGEYRIGVHDDSGAEIAFPFFIVGGADVVITLPIAPRDVPDASCYIPSFPGEEYFVGDEVTRQGDVRSVQGPVWRRAVKATGSFFINRYEVTNAEFERFWRDAEARTFVARAHDEFQGRVDEEAIDLVMVTRPHDWSLGCPASGTEGLPVLGLLAYQAEAFATWSRKALPQERQWEKAARGIDGRNFVYGDVFRPGAHGSMERLPGGSRPIDVSVYGVCDMMASVPEWAHKESGQSHIIRGGWYGSTSPRELRLALRSPAGHLASGVRLVSSDPAPDLQVERKPR